jgi:hypothetical protein
MQKRKAYDEEYDLKTMMMMMMLRGSRESGRVRVPDGICRFDMNRAGTLAIKVRDSITA